MKKMIVALLVSMAAAACSAAQSNKDEGWITLFNGKNLDGWQASENQGTFTVKDGELVVNGARSHLFYAGRLRRHHFRNFEFRADVKTTKGSNSGIYFHTDYQQTGWP